MIPKLEYYKEKWNVQSDRSIKPGLEAIEKALQLLGNPEKQLKIVHVAGTNGKGSTISFLDSLCQAHGLNVGKFMSPCIIDVHDQLQINGQPISEDALDLIFQLFAEKNLSGMLTDFELLTCAAFVYFAGQQVDVALIETGMGGLLDSTNVITPVVSVITSISLEHTNFLGNTIKEIATHKAGIIKKNCPVVVGQLSQDALDIVKQKARDNKAPIYVFGEQFSIEKKTDGEIYHSSDFTFSNLQRTMLGWHQQINMSLALTALIELSKALNVKLEDQKIHFAVQHTSLAGRFEEVYPNIFFEGAHNPASVAALVEIIESNFANKNIEFILGMLKDKDVQAVLQLLEPIASKIQFIDIPNPRALSAEQFYALSKHPNKEIVIDAKQAILAPLEEDTIRIVTGSLYLLADLRVKLSK